MFDLTVLSAVCAVAFVLLFILCYFFLQNREDGFEKAYNADVLALLTENEKKKGKNKNKRGGQGKKEKEPPQKASEATAPAATTPVSTPLQIVTPALPEILLENVTPTETTPESTVLASQRQKPSPKAKKSPKVKDLDQKKVLSRLSAIPELDEAYVQFLTNFFRESEHQKNTLMNELKGLQKKNQEMSQKIDKLNKDKTSAETREKSEQSQRLELSQKVNALQARETELNRQIRSANFNLRTREQELASDAQKLRSTTEQLENELRSLKSSNVSLTNQLEASNEKNQVALANKQNEWHKLYHELDLEKASLVSDLEAAKIKHDELTTLVAKVEAEFEQTGKDWILMSTTIEDLKSQNAALKDALEQGKAITVDLSEVDSKKNELIALLEGDKQKLLDEKALMIEKYARLKDLIQELNTDIVEFHAYKQKQESIVGELNQRDKSRVEELASEKERFEAREQALHDEIAEGRQKLAELRKALEEEKSRIVEIPKNDPKQEVVEEVFELKKANVELAAAPSTSISTDEEKEQLKAENIRLTKKNYELRERNNIILEKTEAEPKLLISERNQVAVALGKLFKKPLKAFDDQSAYYEWIDESISGIQKDLDALKTVASESAATPAVVVSAPAPAKALKSKALQIPQGNEGECRKALVEIIRQLDHISELADEKEKEIVQLRALRA